VATGRLERHTAARSRRRRMTLVGAGLLVAIAVIAVLAGLTVGQLSPRDDAGGIAARTAGETTRASTSTITSAETSALASIPVELPDVAGMPVDQADALLVAAGFVVLQMATPAGEMEGGTVVTQEPVAGTILPRGTNVTIVYASDAPAQPTKALTDPGVSERAARFVVCIDPGHQAKANLAGEPIGPGATETKPKVTGGATGTVTGQAEHELVLAVALLVADRLEAAGVRVVMTRTTAAVDISNAQRAALAKQAGAHLFVRVHADGNTNGDTSGISTLYPAGNDWVRPISAQSKTAATTIHRAVIGATKAADRGVIQRSDLSGFNWSEVPAVLVECGFLSNPAEDRLLATGAYRAKLADGLAQGILAYLEGR